MALSPSDEGFSETPTDRQLLDCKFTQSDPASRRVADFPYDIPYDDLGQQVTQIFLPYDKFKTQVEPPPQVEMRGFEPLASAVQRRRSPN